MKSTENAAGSGGIGALVKQVAVKACVMFTVTMAVWSLVAIAFVGPQYGLVVTLTVLLAAAALAVLQGLWFTDKVIRRLAYPLRILGFGLTAFAALALCAVLGGWLPAGNPAAWGTFAVIYIAILIAMTVIYQIRFKRTVGSYDAALQAYHEKMGRS